MASRGALLRGVWRAASAWEKGGGRAAPAHPLQGAWWRLRAGGNGLANSESRRFSLGQPFWLHTAGMVVHEGDEEEEEKQSSLTFHRRGLLTPEEVNQVLHHVNLTAFKHKLAEDPREHMDLEELLEFCQAERVASSADEAAEVVRSLHQAGQVFVFRRKVFLQPQRLAKLMARALPLELALEDDPRKEEFEKLDQMKADLDAMAHKKVRRHLLGGLVVLSAHFTLFFWLTFWKFSWDVMEPIAFFVTTGALLAGYGYFLTTATDPSYQDMHHRLFLYHQKKLMKKMKFDNERYQFLASQCKSCFSHPREHNHHPYESAMRRKQE